MSSNPRKTSRKSSSTTNKLRSRKGGAVTNRSKPLIKAVRSWLDEQGFPLEMKTAAAFRAAGFEVRQSSYYMDQETGKGREIDVLATHPDPHMLGATRIVFVIECKSSKRPWLILQSPDTLVGFHRYDAFGVLSKTALQAFLEHIDWIDTLPWLKKPLLAGYSLRQALSDKDIAYSASITVAKACQDLVRSEANALPRFTLAFPVIVIDSPLITCTMQKSGRVKLEEIATGEFLFLTAFPNHFGSCIRVVTQTALSAFAKEAKVAANKFRAALTPLEKQLFETWHRGHVKSR